MQVTFKSDLSSHTFKARSVQIKSAQPKGILQNKNATVQH